MGYFVRFLGLGAVCLAACVPSAADDMAFTTTHMLQPLCGNTYLGAVTSGDAVDADWRSEVLKLGPVSCPEGGGFVMPLAVGDNTSRTWFITGAGDTLELRHQHLLDDGSVDPVSDYGGTIRGFPKSVGKAILMEFPVDDKSVAIFKANGLDASITNVWSLEYIPSQSFVYELNRENRNFRAEFDLTQSP